MRKNIHSLLLILGIVVVNNIIAQEIKPVQFVFSTTRVNDSIIRLNVHASIAKNVQLFSVKKRGADDPFVSNLQLDSAFQKYQKRFVNPK